MSQITDVASSSYLEPSRVLQSGQCVAFVGSGPSNECYPTWWKLIEKLCAKCGVSFPANPKTDTLMQLADDCFDRNEQCSVSQPCVSNEASMFDRSQSCQERSQNLVAWMAAHAEEEEEEKWEAREEKTKIVKE